MAQSATIQNRGRCVHLSASQIVIQNENCTWSFSLTHPTQGISVGDIIEILPTDPINRKLDGKVRLLTPNRTKNRTHHWLNRTLDPRRLKAIQVRTQVEHAIREFFLHVISEKLGHPFWSHALAWNLIFVLLFSTEVITLPLSCQPLLNLQ